MKALITKVEYVEAFGTPFGEMHQFRIYYDGKEGLYETKNENQIRFVEGKKSHFTEHKIVNSQGETFKLTPDDAGKTDYGKDMKREKAKYASMAVSYAKDLKVAGKYRSKKLGVLAKELYALMNEIASSSK